LDEDGPSSGLYLEGNEEACGAYNQDSLFEESVGELFLANRLLQDRELLIAK
jgi:hypothetical protein